MDEVSGKAVLILVLTTVVGMAVTGLVTWTVATSSMGIDAAEKTRIKDVLSEEMQMADGRTVIQALTAIDKNQAVMNARMTSLDANVEDIGEDLDIMLRAIQAISADPE